MSNGFQFYEGTTSDSATTPKITVRKGGVLILTKAAVDMLGDDVKHVQIGYNDETKAIGIRSLLATVVMVTGGASAVETLVTEIV